MLISNKGVGLEEDKYFCTSVELLSQFTISDGNKWIHNSH